MADKNPEACHAAFFVQAAKKSWGMAKWVVMAAAIVYLWREGIVSRGQFALSEQALWGLPVALLFLAISTILVSARFHSLLCCLDTPSNLIAQTRLNFSALLAQQIGSEAGYDVVRALGTRAIGGKNADIAAALLVDRLTGFFALAAIATAGAASYWNDTWLFVIPVVAIFVSLAIPSVFLIFYKAEQKTPDGRLWRIPGSGFIASVGASLARYRGSGLVVAVMVAISAVSHFSFFAAIFFCGVSLGDIRVSPFEAVVGGALSSFTGALPLPMAGLGVGEAAFGAVVSGMRGSGGPGDFAAIFLVNRLLVLFLGVVAWIWIVVSGKRILQDGKI